MGKFVKVTRRDLAAAVLSAVPMAAQVSAQAPATAPVDDLETARAQIKKNTELFKKYSVPIATEPSFAFKF